MAYTHGLYVKPDTLTVSVVAYKFRISGIADSQREGAPMHVRTTRQLGEAIRAQRLKMQLRQADLARKASVRQPLISELENGATSARMDTVLKVIAALDLDLDIVARQSGGFDPAAY